MNKSASKAWVAGLFEGEGCISTYKGKRVVVVIQMTDLDVLEKVQENFGGKILKLKERRAHWKQIYSWRISKTSKACDFLETIKQFLCSRRTEKVNEALLIGKRLKENESQKEKSINYRKSIIQKLRDENKTDREIGVVLNVSRSTIQNFRERHSIN